MSKNDLDLSQFKLNYEASGEFSLLLLDIFRNLTKDLELMSIVSDKKLYHCIGKNVLEVALNKALELCSDNIKFGEFNISLENNKERFILLVEKFRTDKEVNIFTQILNTLKEITKQFVLIDFDATAEDEDKIKEKANIYNNYKKIGSMKNELRKFINEAFLINNSHFNKTLVVLAEKLKVNIGDILSYKEIELKSLIYNGEGVAESELDSRRDFIIVSHNSRIYYYFGLDARKELEIIKSEQCANNSTALLKGNTSYLSKEKITGRVFIFMMNFSNINEQVKDFVGRLEDYNGKAILVADVTTPEMMPIFSKVVAIVTTYGGINTHAAIISRELKIPCIVGVKDATRVFKDGDIIEVDTEGGLVRLIK